MRVANDQRKTLVTFLSPPGAGPRDARFNTPSGDWTVAFSALARVRETLPGRGERMVDGLEIAARSYRVQLLWRDGITAAMRLRIGDRVLRITAPPVELGFREGLELMAEELTTTGQVP